ncbi:MAG: hypothetical protein OHK0047_37210 [Leptolyngbyaceae cyanobacterium]
MSRQAIVSWLQQRPWLVVPVLGLIPLVSLPLMSRQSPPSAVAPSPSVAGSPSPLSSISAAALPDMALVSPSAKPTPSAKATPSPRLSPSPKATAPKVAASPVPPARQIDPRVVQAVTSLSADAVIPVRVIIAQGTTSLTIGTSAGGVVMDAQKGNAVYQMPTRSSYQVQADGTTLMMGSIRLPQVVYIEPNPGGITYVGDRGYRGRMVLIANDSHLWAVNHVSMQQYLYSVVGSEVSPSWPMEALKAQAVAARSYALTYHLKPVNRQFYDLGADEYYQVYKGVESEAATTRQAVNSTGGEFVSYRGGVVESLYAATDDIVMEAFQGRGMSQIGALGLAEKGYNYRQILANYYTGTGVARIQMDIE